MTKTAIITHIDPDGFARAKADDGQRLGFCARQIFPGVKVGDRVRAQYAYFCLGNSEGYIWVAYPMPVPMKAWKKTPRDLFADAVK